MVSHEMFDYMSILIWFQSEESRNHSEHILKSINNTDSWYEINGIHSYFINTFCNNLPLLPIFCVAHNRFTQPTLQAILEY